MVNKSKSIPCQQPEDHLPRETEEKLESADGSRIHVLAVDDSFVERKIIEKLLKNSSYKVTTVDSASRALEILGVMGVMEGLASSPPNAFKINLIITDYCMPGMTGYDLLKRVKTFASLKEIPVVIMSSENVPNRINTCLAEGAEEFLLKPVKIADVKRLQWHVRDKKQPSKRSHTDSACTDNRTASEILTVASSGSPECMKRKASFQDAQEDRITERRPRQIGVT